MKPKKIYRTSQSWKVINSWEEQIPKEKEVTDLKDQNPRKRPKGEGLGVDDAGQSVFASEQAYKFSHLSNRNPAHTTTIRLVVCVSLLSSLIKTLIVEMGSNTIILLIDTEQEQNPVLQSQLSFHPWWLPFCISSDDGVPSSFHRLCWSFWKWSQPHARHTF